jgi:cell cycle sensor histidine kinase DivJ
MYEQPRALAARIDALVAPTVHGVAERAKHALVLQALFAGGLAGIATLPVLLATSGLPAHADLAALAFCGLPSALALLLARTGRLGLTIAVLSFATIVLAAIAVAGHGGLSSPLLATLALGPLLALATGGIALCAVMAGIALAALLALVSLAAVEPVSVPYALAALGSALVTLVVMLARATRMAEDIAERTTRAARCEEDRYRLLAEHAGDMITRHTRSGNVLFASPACERLLGVAPSALSEGALFDRVHVADRPAFLRAFSDAAYGSDPVTVEVRLQRATNAEFVAVEITASAAPGENGAMEIVAVTRDVEERRSDREALMRANDETARANAAKTRFLANMSHELRTPLNAIIGFSEMMTLDAVTTMGPERAKEYAQLINDSGRHLLDLVNGILDMSKIDSGSFTLMPEPFDPRTLVTNVTALMQAAAEKAGIDLIFEYPAGEEEVVADRRACKQMLLNLVSNAVKFTERGGRVTTRLAFEAKHVVISVTDTGIGIAEEDLPRLATPFVQAQSSYDRRYEGTGLGLSLVKGLVGLHGGTMAIRSKLGEGTTVTLVLPREAVAAAAQPEVENVTPFPARAPQHAPSPDTLSPVLRMPSVA